jgi:hypothetical protein
MPRQATRAQACTIHYLLFTIYGFYGGGREEAAHLLVWIARKVESIHVRRYFSESNNVPAFPEPARAAYTEPSAVAPNVKVFFGDICRPNGGDYGERGVLLNISKTAKEGLRQ